MIYLTAERSLLNPILSPLPQNYWEADSVFNGSIIKRQIDYYLLYRAVSQAKLWRGRQMNLSSIGIASSKNGEQFSDRRQFIIPQHDWEAFGCEDPRATYLNGDYYIFYTALSDYPPSASSIKVGLAVSNDLRAVKAKYLVTPFNAKAMALFPEKINGKYAVILTANTDLPPAKICVAYLDKLSDLGNHNFWKKWYRNINKFRINLARLNTDQVEVGAVPLLTKSGWLLIYSHIRNYYFPDKRIYGIEACLLDRNDPQKILGRTYKPLLVPGVDYELSGKVKNVIFPSGAMIKDRKVFIYYSAADNHVALAKVSSAKLVRQMKSNPFKQQFRLKKFNHNPILAPNKDLTWQSKAVFNPACVYHKDKFYLIYRALSSDNTSVFGCAVSEDGLEFKQELKDPIYVPRMEFERKQKPDTWSGCEDPRITKIDDRFYMCYTAYDGIHSPRVAITWISVADFEKQQWLWSEPKLVSPAQRNDKNAALFPEKINGKYAFFHRIDNRDIALDYRDDLDFDDQVWLEKEGSICPREGSWDDYKIGIAGPPLKTKLGWLVLYHAISSIDHYYRIGFMILDIADPLKVLYRSKYPILEPTESFEREGLVNNVVFACGNVIVDGQLFVYYGGADKVVCVATASLEKLLSYLPITPGVLTP